MAGRVRLVTWNVRAAIGPGPFPDAWWRRIDVARLEAVGRLLAELDADVVALQELAVLAVDGRLVDTATPLARAAARNLGFAATRHFPIDEGGRRVGAGLFGNALLTRGDATCRTVALPMAPDDAPVEPAGSGREHAGIAYRDAPPGVREPRCLVLAEIDRLRIGSTHLSHRGAAERALQAAACDAALGPGPAILAGDLNAAIEDDELRILREGWTDAFADAGVPPGDARRVTTEDGMRIDHVLGRGVRVVDCRVVGQAAWLSDHLPVLATLEA